MLLPIALARTGCEVTQTLDLLQKLSEEGIRIPPPPKRHIEMQFRHYIDGLTTLCDNTLPKALKLS